MPVVRAQRQVRSDALPGVRRQAHVTDLAAGVGVEHAKADVGMAIARVGHEFADRGVALYAKQRQEARQQQHQVVLQAATNQVDKWMIDRIHDPQKGALTTKGRAALGLSDTISTEYKALIGGIAQGLGTDEAKADFAKWAEARGFALDVDMTRLEMRELDADDQAETVAKLKNVQTIAVAHADDPKGLAATAIAEGVQAIEQRGARAGTGPDAIQSQVAAFRSDTTAAIIENLLAQQQPDKARLVFDIAKKDGVLIGDTLTKLTEAMEIGNVRQQVQEATAKILAAGGTETEQRAAAKALPSAYQDEVLRRVEHEHGIARQQKDAAEEETSKRVYDILDATNDLTKIPPAIWRDMSGARRTAAENYIKKSAEPGGVKTDWNAFYYYNTLATNEATRDAFAKFDLTQIFHLLGNTERKHLMDVQIATRNKDDAKVDQLLSSESMQNQIVSDGLRSVDIDPTPIDPGAKMTAAQKIMSDRAVAFRRAERNAKAALEARTGKPATDAEVQGIVDVLLTRGTAPGRLAYEVGQAHIARAADVPRGERKKIEDAARRAGQWPLSEAALIEKYNLRLQQIRGDR